MNAFPGSRATMLALALLLAGGGLAFPDDGQDRDEHDHDEARRAVEEGRVRPLAEILAELAGQLGGKVVGIEFERKNERYVYEFKVITAAGRLREIRVDAASAEILDSEDD